MGDRERAALGRGETDDHFNDTIAIPALLKTLEIKRRVVTIDAMGRRKKTARHVVKRDSDYILAVKKNQPRLWDDIDGAFEYCERTRFASIEHDVFETVNEDKNKLFRIESSQIPLFGLMLTLFMTVFAMFGWLKLDIGALRLNMNAMRAELKSEMSKIRARLDRIESDISDLKTDVALIKARLDAREARATSVENRIANIENRVARIETQLAANGDMPREYEALRARVEILESRSQSG